MKMIYWDNCTFKFYIQRFCYGALIRWTLLKTLTLFSVLYICYVDRNVDISIVEIIDDFILRVFTVM